MNDPDDVIRYTHKDVYEEGGDYESSNGIIDEFGRTIDVKYDEFFGSADVVAILRFLTNEQAVVVLLTYARFNTQEIADTLHFRNKKKVYYIVEQVRNILGKQNLLEN